MRAFDTLSYSWLDKNYSMVLWYLEAFCRLEYANVEGMICVYDYEQVDF